MKKYKAGVLFGEELEALYNDAKDNQFALPAVNTIGTNTINAVLETAAKVNSPVIIQFSKYLIHFRLAIIYHFTKWIYIVFFPRVENSQGYPFRRLCTLQQ